VISAENYHNLRWKYWQCFFEYKIPSDFVADVLQQKTDPWLTCFHYISKLFDGYQTILETPQDLLRNPPIFRRSLQVFLSDRQICLRILILRIFWGSQTSSSEFFEDPQNFLRILILRIFWGSSEFSEDRHPQTFLRNVIFRIFWRSSSSEFSEDHHPLNFLRIVILRIFADPQNFWGSSSSEFSKDPPNFLRMFRIFWGSSSSQFSEDRHPQNFLMIVILRKILILRIFWGSSSSEFSAWGSSEFSEDRHPQNFLKILRIFWGSSSSEFSEGLHLQKIEKFVILRIFWGSSELSLDKRFLFENKIFFWHILIHKNAYWAKILRILRKFWGWRSSENFEDKDPQKILVILRKFWGWRSSENPEDPQKILRMRILRKFWGSSKNSEDDDLQKILRMTIIRKFWGWRSSENCEDDDPQKILRILRKFWGWGSPENSEESLDFLTIIRKNRLMTIPLPWVSKSSDFSFFDVLLYFDFLLVKFTFA